MTDLLERIALVKQRWTVPELVETLTGEPVPSSRKVHSFFNDADNTPSLHLYDDSWYDYSTGKYGDVVDLIRLTRRCTVERAVQILEEEADDLGLVSVVRTVAPKPVFVMPADLWRYGGESDDDGPASLLTALPGVAPRTIRNLWFGGRIGMRAGDLAIMHYGEQSTPIGIKYRNMTTGRKTSEPGSDFSSALYQPFDYGYGLSCVITEGETDSWAWLSVRPDDHVYSLPSGAQSWKDKFTEQLEGYDDIWLAFDNDPAGRDATAKVTNSIGYGKTRWVQIPSLYNDVRAAVAAGWTPRLG